VDYTFRLDDYQRPVAELAMGHEAFARWLSEELGSKLTAIQHLVKTIERIEAGQLHRHQQTGREFQLHIDHDEVEIIALALASDSDDELPEDTELFDQQLYAECGLQDFKQVLRSWQQFVAETN
jgi:uncharacterized protein YacL (UPF0231 family)